jgi:hypothetical protein
MLSKEYLETARTLRRAALWACASGFPRRGIVKSANQDFGFAFSLSTRPAATSQRKSLVKLDTGAAG